MSRQAFSAGARTLCIVTFIGFFASGPVFAETVTPQQPSTPVSYFYDAAGKQRVRVSETEFLVKASASQNRTRGVVPSDWPGLAATDLNEVVRKTEERLRQRDWFVLRGVSPAQIAGLKNAEYALPVLYREDSDIPLYQTNRVIVGLKPGVDVKDLGDFAQARNCELKPLTRGEGRYLLIVKDVNAHAPLNVANALFERGDIAAYSEPDFIAPKITYSPPVINDPLYHSHQWHLDGDTSKGADAGSDINVEAAWDSIHGPDAEGVSQVRVSIIDECVEKLHPDLFPNWAAGIDLDEDPPDDDPSPDGGQRHGTSCAGVAVAKGNNIGVRGACPNCGLIGVKFFGATIAETADAFYFSMDPDDNGNHSDGATIMSNSWGFADGTLQPSDVVNAINSTAANGRNGLGCIILFASANNDHTVNGVSALAQLPSVMAVGGTNSHNVHTEFSDVGPEVGIGTPTNDRGDDGVRFSWIDITTVDNTGTSGYNGLPNDPDYTNAFGGTSSATPLAAGVLGLIFSQDPTMTAAQGRAILQHTAVRIDEPYGRFDGITSHSHRFGFGQADAAQAVAAANAGTRWPDRIKTMNASGIGSDVVLSWGTPPNDYASSLLVRSSVPFAWVPTDGATYTVGQIVAPGVQVIYNGAVGSHTDLGASAGGFFYGVYPRSSLNRYGFGARAHIFRSAINLFIDNSEAADPGWTHGGTNDEWQRGTPTAVNVSMSQAVAGSGPLTGTHGTRCIGGNKCWATDLGFTYDANTDAYLQTPFVNLTGVNIPVILEYWDWCLLETFYDNCSIEVVNTNNQVIGVLDPSTGGDYDWTLRAYDLTAYAGQPIAVRFRIVSDGSYQRDGWFIDDVRIVAAGLQNFPPVANNKTAETTLNTTTAIILPATDPNPATTLDYVIKSLPAHGQLNDPQGGPINAAPYTLVNHATIVHYAPTTSYQGPDSFTFGATDGSLDSNIATISLTIGTPVPVYSFPLDSDPGWATEGQWAFGQPTGQVNDPTTGFTGLHVYGYNLNGAYPDNLPPRYLTMTPLNCTGLSRVTLKFARWLGVENASFDKASIQVSTDGNTWTTIWANSGVDIEEIAWSQQSYNIGAIADNQPFVLIRWGMGPTDTNTTFGGWNIDDVVVAAIGSAPGNQPPLAKNVAAETAINTSVDIELDAVDSNNDPIEYRIVSLPTGGTLSDPNGGVISSTPYTLLAGGDVVTYTPDPGFDDPDDFLYRGFDGSLQSNAGSVAITLLNPASFEFNDGFESGTLANYWSTRITGAGRIVISSSNAPQGTRHVQMDSSSSGTFGSNELTLVVDLEGHSNVLLRYSWKEFADETHTLPSTWTDHADGDGVGISEDGIHWTRIANLTEGTNTYQTVTIDLDTAAANAGLTYNKTFRIRFQQYDDNTIATDGIALDNIRLIQGTQDPVISTSSFPDGQVGELYGPIAMQAIGGDPPLSWSLLNIYGEDSLGASQFAEVGTAQNLHANDGASSVIDYALPFSFPFYGTNYTSIKIAVDGWINFGSFVGSTWSNSAALLAANKRIAVLWDDLRTTAVNNDVFIDSSVVNQVTIRWNAVTHSGLLPCNFSATLHSDGRVDMHYGSGNTGLTPTVGVSAGDNVQFSLAGYDADSTLTLVNSIEMQQSKLPPGITMDSFGFIGGTPTTKGSFKPIFKVQDQSNRTHTKMIPIHVPVGMFGDFDNDLDVDGADFTQFRLCFTGSDNGPLVSGCETGDDDSDDDIDCADWHAFRAAHEASSGLTPVMEVEEFIAVLLDDPDSTEADLCIADTNDDGLNDGADVQAYVDAVLGL